jgi:hypothetical protein
VSDDELLDPFAALSKINGFTAVQCGARIELLVSVLTHRADIVESFRNRIVDLMS